MRETLGVRDCLLVCLVARETKEKPIAKRSFPRPVLATKGARGCQKDQGLKMPK